MTERTYTETEVQAIRAAALRGAADIDRKYWGAQTVVGKRILALIDQPAEDALNAMIGAAYIDAHGENDTCAKCGHPKADHHYRHPFVSTKAEGRTPADALAALERVKRETLTRGFDLGFAVSAEGWNGEYPGDAQDTEYYCERRAAAVRGESE